MFRGAGSMTIRNDDMIQGQRSANDTVAQGLPLAPVVEPRRCPKCSAEVSALADECRACGIVISKYRASVGPDIPEVRADLRRDLIEMWQSVLRDYDSDIVHEKFIGACDEADQLAYAAHKYARILSVTPNEETARVMRERVRGLALSKLDRRTPEAAWEFQRPRAIDVTLVFCTFAIVGGLMLPGQAWLAGFAATIGAGLLALRVFLKPPRLH